MGTAQQLRWPDDVLPGPDADGGGTGPVGTTPGGAHSVAGEARVVVDRPEVLVRTSTRRRKTAAAYWEGSRIVVQLPAHVRRTERASLVEWLVQRVLAKRPLVSWSDDVLASRAAVLADRYVGGVRPWSIRWVSNQAKRWASCSADTGEIRLSHRLRFVPEWVLDATIVHELAHLVHPNHSPEFHAIANRYPRQQEATIFLEGYSLGLEVSGPSGGWVPSLADSAESLVAMERAPARPPR